MRIDTRIVMALVIGASVAAFAPIYPRLPESLLDPSWMLAMNQAVAQGLVFGRDIVFTFGPYSSMYTQAYHPATYTLALAFGSLLGLSYAAMLWLLMKRPRPGWLLACAGFLLLIDSRDTLFFSYPLVLVLLAFRFTHEPSDPVDLVWNRPPKLGLVLGLGFTLAIAMLGLLPIVKGSFQLLAMLAALAGFVMFWQRGARVFATLFIVLPLLTLAAAWQAAGQPLAALPDYFHTMAPIISGYSEAMAIYPSLNVWWVTRIGVPGMIAAYIALAALVMLAVARVSGRPSTRSIAMVGFIGLFFATVLKASFVRHDAHALTAGSALVLAIILLTLSDLVRLSGRVVASSVVVWVLIHGIYMRTSIEESPLASLYGAYSGERRGANLQAAFNRKLEAIRSESPVKMLSGSTDIYPYDLAALIASGNLWMPRPVPQSYSVYTPTLAKFNDDHLHGSKAPQNIVFRLDAIDHHLPALEDGLSWPSLLSHYSITAQDARYLYFNRRSESTRLKQTLLMKGNTHCGDSVELPQRPGILFVQIQIKPTLLGRLANILFKTSPLSLSVDTADGQAHSFRLIAGMAESGFILSPLVQTNADWVQLAGAPSQWLARNRVQRFRVAAAEGGSIFWQSAYDFKLFLLDDHASQPSK